MMATDRPRFSVSLDDETFERVEQYRLNGRYTTRSKAVEALIFNGLQKLSATAFEDTQKAPSISDEAMQIAIAFEAADEDHKDIVRTALSKYLAAPAQKGRGAKLA